MTIEIDGSHYTSEQIIEAILAGQTVDDEATSIAKALMVRLEALEKRLPITRYGYGVVKTPRSDGVTTYRVQTIDELGRTIITTFEIHE